MKKNRLIPVLLLKNGWLVQSKGFNRYQNLGNPTTAVKRISEWGSDELIYLDISKDDEYDFYHLKKDSSNLKTLKLLVSKDQDLAAKVGKKSHQRNIYFY